ncbi:STAS domain-containing protein [bacterium]|nr:STAS domain-containing protein [bacterium]
MNVEYEVIEGHIVFRPYSELELLNIHELTGAIQKAAAGAKSKRMLIDASNVPFVDSTALGALVIEARKLSEDGGYIHFFGARPGLIESLYITKLERMLKPFKTLEEALAFEPMVAAE